MHTCFGHARRLCLRHGRSCRDVEEFLIERGIQVNHAGSTADGYQRSSRSPRASSSCTLSRNPRLACSCCWQSAWPLSRVARWNIWCSLHRGRSGLGVGSAPRLRGLIIRLIIQTIRRDRTRSVWTDEAPNVSRPDPTGADQIDAAHQATDLAVGGSNPSRRAHFRMSKPMKRAKSLFRWACGQRSSRFLVDQQGEHSRPRTP
jgi:hypothetical protein